MTLARRRGEFLLFAGEDRLMTSSLHVSEERLAAEALAEGDFRRVLVGGLGMGFTLRAALDSVSDEAEVVVAELVSEVVDWNREFLGKLANHPLRDPRTTVFVGDVAQLLGGEEMWDAILLDVDNGATAFTKGDNQALYEEDGIARIADSLNPGGVWAVWSTSPNKKFERKLKRAGFRIETRRIEEYLGKTKYYHYLFIAKLNRNSNYSATQAAQARLYT